MSAQTALDIMQAIRRGAFLEDLGSAFQQAVEAQQEHGRQATVTVSFKLEPVKEAHDRTLLTVAAAISMRLPQREPLRQVFYATDDPAAPLSTRDPRQPDMFEPRVVADEESPAREAEQKAGEG